MLPCSRPIFRASLHVIDSHSCRQSHQGAQETAGRLPKKEAMHSAIKLQAVAHKDPWDLPACYWTAAVRPGLGWGATLPGRPDCRIPAFTEHQQVTIRKKRKKRTKKKNIQWRYWYWPRSHVETVDSAELESQGS